MATKVVIEVDVKDGEIDALKSELKGLGVDFHTVEDNAKKVGKEVKNLGIDSKIISKLDSLTGGWASSIIDVVDGLKGVVKAINLSKAALISTGIGAFVVALGLIVTYWDDILETVTGVNVELQEQKELSDEINLALERRNQLEKDNARFVDVRTKERLLRAKVAGASESELTQIEREGLQERLELAEQYAKEADRILQESATADADAYKKALDNQIKAYDELAKARTAVGFFNLEQQIPGKSKPQRGEDQESVEPLPLTGLAGFDALDTTINAEFDALALGQSARSKMELAASMERRRIADAEAQAKSAAFMVAADAFTSAGELIGKQTAVGKALAIAGALISTYQSAVNSYNALSPIPIYGPVLGAVAAAAAVASGLAQVKAIASVKVPGQGSGGAGASASTPPAFNVVANNPQNQLNQTLLEGNNAPAEVFVVDKNVTTAQEMRRNRIESSSIG